MCVQPIRRQFSHDVFLVILVCNCTKNINLVFACEMNGEISVIESLLTFFPAKCGPVPSLANSEVVWHNRSVVIHRCEAGFHSWRGTNVSLCGSSGVWQEATLKCIGEH